MCKKLFLTLVIIALATPIFAQKSTSNKHQYVYDISYKKIELGQLVVDINWDGQKGVVRTLADMSFLYIDFSGSQESNVYRDQLSKKILTKNFSRVSKGFSNVNMTANFFKDGHKVIINNNGKEQTFTDKNNQIIDFNAIVLQIGDALKARKTHFDFYMQTSKKVAHYFFIVTGQELIKTKFGTINTFKVVQARKNDRVLQIWFAPSMNYKMVKFHYQRNIIDINVELVKHS